MSDPLQSLLIQHLPKDNQALHDLDSANIATKYLPRLLSLRLSDLNTTEPESLTQAAHSNHVLIQALSSRSHKASTTASDHLATLKDLLPELATSVNEIRNAVPRLDDSAVQFSTSHSRTQEDNVALVHRKEAMLLSRQADRLQDILELPTLLSTTIASAASGPGGVNHSQALDLLAHIKRLQILYPESQLIRSILDDSHQAMKEMATNLISSLRGHNIRLASAIRTIGWLRRVVPELQPAPTSVPNTTSLPIQPLPQQQQDESYFGALFLTCRLYTFLTTFEALSPLRDLADQETHRRQTGISSTQQSNQRPSAYATEGQQTERYLKRYIEIFREQSFSTISMYRQIFLPTESSESDQQPSTEDPLQLPSALSSFPLHLVEMFMETLRVYLPNVTDPVARESLLMQVLYAANSLGRLGGDFSLIIALLEIEMDVVAKGDGIEENNKAAGSEDEQEVNGANGKTTEDEDTKEQREKQNGEEEVEPEWVRVIRKHRVQSARLEAMAAGQDLGSRKPSQDIPVR